MTVQALDHVNIRTRDPEATKAFLIDVLEMSAHPVQQTWVTDAAGRPIVHLGAVDFRYSTDDWRPFTPREDSGSIHHVALSCSDYDAVVARLDERGIDHSSADYPAMDLRQVFVIEPGGVMLELNFHRALDRRLNEDGGA